MIINTDLFGEIVVDKTKIITFESGLPAFPDEKSFVILTNEDNKEGVFFWLQSISNNSLTFALIDPFIIMPHYKPLFKEESITDLGEHREQDIYIYNIVSVPEEISNITANLKAPIIINIKNGKGKQVIVDNEEYSIRHNIFENLKKSKVGD